MDMNLAAAVAFLVSGILAYNKNDAWGWFLFAGIIAVVP